MNTLIHRTFRIAFALFLATIPIANAPAAESDRPPNIVVIFADDLGYGDLGCYGNDVIRTPNLDRMAAEGMRFTQIYTPANVCTPSRVALLTGRHACRVGLTTIIFPATKIGLPESERTTADILKQAGYKTACIGKWHLGHLPQFWPTNRGFDTYYGIPYSNDMDVERRGDPPIPLYRATEIIEQPVDQRTITRRYAEEAAKFIEANKDEPFYVYLPHSMPHIPLFASEEFEGKSERGLYGDVIEELDASVGTVLDAIEDASIDEHTLVLFTSDNGPWLAKGDRGGSAGPLRHGKGSPFEGGHRVPCIVRWPGAIPAGHVQETPASTLDLLPTFAKLAKTALPNDRPYDGADIGGLLRRGDEHTIGTFIFHRAKTPQAIRQGDWKMIRPFRGRIYGDPLEHDVLLFNLAEDPGEQNNLADRHPDRAAAFEARLRAFETEIGAE